MTAASSPVNPSRVHTAVCGLILASLNATNLPNRFLGLVVPWKNMRTPLNEVMEGSLFVSLIVRLFPGAIVADDVATCKPKPREGEGGAE